MLKELSSVVFSKLPMEIKSSDDKLICVIFSSIFEHVLVQISSVVSIRPMGIALQFKQPSDNTLVCIVYSLAEGLEYMLTEPVFPTNFVFCH